MIHLDTNYLIDVLRPGSPADSQLRRWLSTGEEIGASAIAWGEFLCGPLSVAQAQVVRDLLSHVEPVDESDAARAAKLFNTGGRRRGTFQDCLIASVAIRSRAVLATRNPADFIRFEAAGLQLATRT